MKIENVYSFHFIINVSVGRGTAGGTGRQIWPLCFCERPRKNRWGLLFVLLQTF